MTNTGKKTPHMPDLKKMLDKRVSLKLNANRTVEGILRGYDFYLNVFLDEAKEVVDKTPQRDLGQMMVRGSAVVSIDCLERI
ncbi:putative small nuclear ribonucleoprotein polypeptide G [Blattamonas nauphoetae]|uniref:Sm protein G n=1 Tax=Blattamonas nauphoetae TaxID=2049346 RepID=A0ABQ9YKM3_9EUKA|nr:putative small nuclear ribonucleoprotein polypeptide G [Blattamonas nauphoetae]